MIELLCDEAALGRASAMDIEALTRAATDATFYQEDLRPDQIAHNRHIVEISGPTALAAAREAHQRFVAAFVEGRFGGYVIATVHNPDNRELDWLMVHPDFHGTVVSRLLMKEGMDWLGPDRPMWLNVIQYNERAIRFYRRFGFEIASPGSPERPIPQFIMRREPEASSRAARIRR